MNRNMELSGQSCEHLLWHPEEGHQLHREALSDYCQLQAAALADGIELRIASGFRGFDRQLAIWNAKATGLRPVFSDRGQVLNLASLSNKEKVYAILRWSALPGTSRHHWGTDIDVYDAAAIGEEYTVRLTQDEYREGGPFYRLHKWLLNAMDTGRSSGFFQPYAQDRGGVAPEPWHISHRPSAGQYEQSFCRDWLESVIVGTHIELKAEIVDHLDDILRRFVDLPEESLSEKGD